MSYSLATLTSFPFIAHQSHICSMTITIEKLNRKICILTPTIKVWYTYFGQLSVEVDDDIGNTLNGGKTYISSTTTPEVCPYINSAKL